MRNMYVIWITFFLFDGRLIEKGTCVWTRVATSPIFLLKRSIGRFVERRIVPAFLLPSFYVISVPILTRYVPPSRSTLDSTLCIGLYVLRKQTNQYQSLKFPWLHGMFHFKWDGRLSRLRLKRKSESYRAITRTEEQTFMRSTCESFSLFIW